MVQRFFAKAAAWLLLLMPLATADEFGVLIQSGSAADPNKFSAGLCYVLVHGQLDVDDGEPTEARPGHVPRGPICDAKRASAAVSTGRTDPRLAPFDRLMAEFIERHQVPGAALAVTDRGRLVYAWGFGYADVASGEKVEPTSLFRIASISKPITAVAVLQLVERDRLRLDEQVFNLLHWSGFADEEACFDRRLRSITVRHLLEHRGGWDRDESFDPMFRSLRFAEARGVSPPAGPEAVIRSMFTQPLDFDPGTRYAYSNYGYCLLGRIIEEVTGRPYEEYVKKNVLGPLGITAMTLGRTRLEDRRDGEVRYYDPGQGKSVFAEDLNEPTATPYGAWYLEAMDAHGAWLASAVDLARFAAAFDEPKSCNLLSEESIRIMYQRPAGQTADETKAVAEPTYYSCGWQNRELAGGRFNRWHSGSLPGTSALLVRRHDGRNWVVLFNARESSHTSRLGREIDPRLHEAADAVTDWPEYDLFEEYR